MWLEAIPDEELDNIRRGILATLMADLSKGPGPDVMPPDCGELNSDVESDEDDGDRWVK
jgi:hypothetical protein